MNKQTANSLFIVSPYAKKQPGFYQELLEGISGYEQLGNKLVYLSQQAHSVRRLDKLQEFALLLSNLPLQSYRAIGQYYLALCMCRNGLGDIDQARIILEEIANNAPLYFRAKAMLALSAVSWDREAPNETFKYCLDASKLVGQLTIS
jgi:hypothetical protein